MKCCVACGAVKPVEDFFRRSCAVDGRQARCKSCCKALEALSLKRRTERMAADAEYAETVLARGRAWRRKQRDDRYGLEPGTVERMEAEQSGLCAACGRAPAAVGFARTLHVDHDHETGRVRGLLCHGCNLILGHADDSVDRLMALAAYLLSDVDLLVGGR